MDSLTDYDIAKAIVQSGQSGDDWDTLRQGKGSWPEDERKGWKQYRNYSLTELKEEMRIYKQNTASAGQMAPAPTGKFTFIAFCFFHYPLIAHYCFY